MLMRLLKGRRMALTVATTSAVLAASVAYAAIPAADGTIRGCYDDAGNLKVIDEAATCASGTTALQWGPGFRHRGGFDRAASYEVGDVVYDDTRFAAAGSCGLSYNPTAGSYVKVKAGADSWNPSGSYSNASPCNSLNWRLVAQRGPTGATGLRGPQGPAGTANVHWARVDSEGRMTAKSSENVYTGWFDTGGYYFGVSNLDLRKCAISITPDRRHPDTAPASAEIYETYSSYTMFYMKRYKPSAWPLAHERVNVAFYVSASCT